MGSTPINPTIPPPPPITDDTTTWYDPDTNTWQQTPGSPTPITSTVTAFGLSGPNIDPVQAGKNTGTGWSQSGAFGSLALSMWQALMSLIDWMIAQYFDAYDRVIAYIANQVTLAVGRDRPGFWILIGAMISDLLGVNLDGTQLFAQLQSRGTLPAMQGVGSGLIDLLVGEFTGTASGTGGNVSFSTQVDAATGLPQGTLTPTQGVLAAKALMGFVLSSAVRQANVDGLVDAIPFGFGAAFEKYSEGMRNNLGIGRLMRFALKPIFTDLVATPMKWAINKEYRPSLLSPTDAWHAWAADPTGAFPINEEIARHGYDATRIAALQWTSLEKPTREELRLLHLTGNLADSDYALWMGRLGYTPEVTALLDMHDDILPARHAIMADVTKAAAKYLTGAYSTAQFQSILAGLSVNQNGSPSMTPGEVAALVAMLPLSATATALKPKRLGVGQLIVMYIDGIITLQEFEAQLTAWGYDSDQVTELSEMLLVRARAAAEKAAKAAAAAAVAAATAAGKGETALAAAETALSQQTGIPGLPNL